MRTVSKLRYDDYDIMYFVVMEKNVKKKEQKEKKTTIDRKRRKVLTR